MPELDAMKKTFYLAGRLEAGEAQIEEFATELEQHGHTVLEKWWEVGALPKPYLDNPEQCSVAAYLMIQAAFNSEMFVMFPQEGILGAAVELGAALGSTMIRPDKRVIIVDPFQARQSVFYTYPRVEIAPDMDSLRKMVL